MKSANTIITIAIRRSIVLWNYPRFFTSQVPKLCRMHPFHWTIDSKLRSFLRTTIEEGMEVARRNDRNEEENGLRACHVRRGTNYRRSCRISAAIAPTSLDYALIEMHDACALSPSLHVMNGILIPSMRYKLCNVLPAIFAI